MGRPCCGRAVVRGRVAVGRAGVPRGILNITIFKDPKRYNHDHRYHHHHLAVLSKKDLSNKDICFMIQCDGGCLCPISSWRS